LDLFFLLLNKWKEGNKCNLQQQLLSYREHNLFNKRKRNAKIIPKQSSFNQKSPTIPERLTTKPVLASAPAEESIFLFKSTSFEHNLKGS
jgi:hypothetical protein